MKIIYTKTNPEVVKQNRNFYKNHVRKAFVMWCAYEGFFDGVLSEAEIAQAKKGVLPKDLNIHHKIPLSGSDDPIVNEFANLAVLHKRTHEFINKAYFNPQLEPLKDAPYGASISMDVPDYPPVDGEGIKQQRKVARYFLLKRIMEM